MYKCMFDRKNGGKVKLPGPSIDAKNNFSGSNYPRKGVDTRLSNKQPCLKEFVLRNKRNSPS